MQQPKFFTRFTADIGSRLRRDEGSASLEFITAGMLLLIPLVYLVVAVGAVQGATLATEGAARQAARVYVESPTTDIGAQRAQQAIDFALADYGLDSRQATVTITCSSSCLEPESLVTIGVGVSVAMPLVPAVLNLDQAAVVPVNAQASQVVSRFHGVR
jgi:Flp pilus assembly protein TadG